MKSRSLFVAAASVVVTLLSVPRASAQDGSPVVVSEEPTPITGPQSVPQNRIAGEFRPMLGNDAEAVVQGLRTGSTITLTETTPAALPNDPPQVTTVTIESPTGPLGNGEVQHTLDLARFELAQAGIDQPTASQLQAALTGGSVTNADGVTTDLQGVLTLRSEGMGWGEIARQEGTTLGALKNGSAAAPAAATAPAADAGTADPGTTAGSATENTRVRGRAPATGASATTDSSGAAASGGGVARDEAVTNALGAAGAGNGHGGPKVTNALGAGAASHGRSDSHITDALGAGDSAGQGRGHEIVDALGSSGGSAHGGHVSNALGSSGGSGSHAGIVNGLGAGAVEGGRGASMVTNAAGDSGPGLGNGSGGGGGHGGGHGHAH
jgi:hypothetical protein